MSIELLFLMAAFAMGIAQLLNGVFQLRHPAPTEIPTGQMVYFATELSWTALCMYLVLTGRLPTAQWLALAFIAYIPLSVVVGFVFNPRMMEQDRADWRTPRPYAYFTILFGVSAALASLFVISRL